jgi:hypothetical protein
LQGVGLALAWRVRRGNSQARQPSQARKRCAPMSDALGICASVANRASGSELCLAEFRAWRSMRCRRCWQSTSRANASVISERLGDVLDLPLMRPSCRRRRGLGELDGGLVLTQPVVHEKVGCDLFKPIGR